MSDFLGVVNEVAEDLPFWNIPIFREGQCHFVKRNCYFVPQEQYVGSNQLMDMFFRTVGLVCALLQFQPILV